MHYLRALHRVAIVVVVVVAVASCGSQRREPVARTTPPQTSSAVADAALADAVPADSTALAAQEDAGVPIDAALPFRPFVAPKPIASPGAATPQSKACRKTGIADWTRERRRELAAIDAALRAKGGMVLPTIRLDFGGVVTAQVGNVIRGRDGERLLVVALTGICDPSEVPLIGIDRASDVFIILPQFKPKVVRKVSLCQPICGGCGIEPPMSTIVAEVPDGARFVDMRDVPVSIGVQVELGSFEANGQPKACKPVP